MLVGVRVGQGGCRAEQPELPEHREDGAQGAGGATLLQGIERLAGDAAGLREFFLALANQARISIHVDTRGAENSHHAAEAVFKALGKALAQAYGPGRAMSTKGGLG